MRTVGVRDLKTRTSEILRRVRDQGESVEITHRGRVVAQIVPIGEPPRPMSQAEQQAFWAEWDRLAEEISEAWQPEAMSAVYAVREQRREF